MRRVTLLIGCLALVALVTPLRVAAASALSPWVQGVVERVQAGIATAASMPAATCSADADGALLDEVDDALRAAMGSVVSLEDSSRFSQEKTVCAEHDRRLLLRLFDQVSAQATIAATQCRRDAAYALMATAAYLGDAYTSFLRGVDDPTVIDARLRFVYPFESSTRWQSGETTPEAIPDSSAPLCPFTSDYGPHSLGIDRTTYRALPTPIIAEASYGCDLPMLDCLAAASDALPEGCDAGIAAMADASIKSEAQAQAAALRSIDAIARPLLDSVSVGEQTYAAIIDALTGVRPPTSLTRAVPPPPHATVSGCVRPPIPATSTEDDPLDADRALLALPGFADASYRASLGLDPARDSAEPPPRERWPWWMLVRSTNEGPLSVVRAFVDARVRAGTLRPLPAGSLPDDLSTHPFAASLQEDLLSLLAASGDIDRVGAIAELVSRDAFERAEASSRGLRTAVRALSTVTETFLPERYIPDFAYFLLRSCAGGPCEERLLAITQRSFNPYCHPFLSGKFLEKDVPAKCFCTGSYAAEPYCQGTRSDPALQPPAPLQCGM